jgi:Domain of unknown function (DUF5004)
MKAKLLKLVLLFTIISIRINAQNLNETEIVGSWKVVSVHVANDNLFPKDQKAKLAAVKKSFLKSIFKFNADKMFSFDFDIKEMEIKKGHWKIDKMAKTFIIQEWKDKDTNKSQLMEIAAKKVGDKIVFSIAETFMELEMVKY